MKVLITGGAGFIGSHLSDLLLSAGHSVSVIDNLSTGKKENLKPHENLKITIGSITDVTLLNNIFDEFKPDYVVHAAASYKDPDAWEEDVQTNVAGTVNVINASKKLGVKRLIYFQTSLCYGLNPAEQPITLKCPLDSDGSSYALSKTVAERYIFHSGLDFISFRLANMYGPRNLSGPLPTFYHRIVNGKPCFVMNTRRDFLYISDLIRVVMSALEGKGHAGAYHVSSGKDSSIDELYRLVNFNLGNKGATDVEVKERGPDDAFTILLDPGKTKEDFGWQAEVQLNDGVKNAIDWLKTQEVRETFTHLKNIS